jgi:hypothetical protein
MSVGRANDDPFTEGAAAFGAFAGEQMPAAGAGAHDFAAGGDFEPFGDGLLGFLISGAAHRYEAEIQR